MDKELTAVETLRLLKDFVLENNESGLDRSFICGSFDAIEKELKAHEIIKKSDCPADIISAIGYYKTYDELLKDEYPFCTEDDLSSDEFDLLKGVLK